MTQRRVVLRLHDQLGRTYDCYKAVFNHDSYDNAGARLVGQEGKNRPSSQGLSLRRFFASQVVSRTSRT